MSRTKETIAELFPHLTAKQSQVLEAELDPFIADFKPATARMTAEWLGETRPELVRKAPNLETVQKFLEQKYCSEHGVDRIPAFARIDIARKLENADADARLEMVPADFAPVTNEPTNVQKQTELASQESDQEKDDRWIKLTFGIDAATLLPSKRRAYLEERDKQLQGRLQDAKRVDAMQLRDLEGMSARDKLTLHRAQSGLK